MNFLKNIVSLALLMVSMVGTAQQENVFLDRSFWKGSPSLETVQ